MEKDAISLKSLIPYINGVYGITLEEKDKWRLYNAVYIIKEVDGDQTYLEGCFAITMFVEKGKDAEEHARRAENENIELLMIIDVKGALIQAAFEEITNKRCFDTVSFVQ